jgi:hypothetical protein
MIQVVDAEGEDGLDHARRLFRSYLAEFAGSFAEAFRLQDLEAEVAGLPGQYAPPSGCLLLAIDCDFPLVLQPQKKSRRLGRLKG